MLSVASTGFVSPPTGLSLTHSSRTKTFTVSWNAGIGNGGTGGCKIQFLKSNAIWTDLLSVNCDSAGSSVGTVSLPGDGWYGASWSNVSIRLIRVSDSTAIGTLGSLSCTTIASSPTSTPNIDEDCNGAWDNGVSAGQFISYLPGCSGTQCQLANRQYSFTGYAGSCNRSTQNMQTCGSLGYAYLEVGYGTTCYCSSSNSYTAGSADILVVGTGSYN